MLNWQWDIHNFHNFRHHQKCSVRVIIWLYYCTFLLSFILLGCVYQISRTFIWWRNDKSLSFRAEILHFLHFLLNTCLSSTYTRMSRFCDRGNFIGHVEKTPISLLSWFLYSYITIECLKYSSWLYIIFHVGLSMVFMVFSIF